MFDRSGTQFRYGYAWMVHRLTCHGVQVLLGVCLRLAYVSTHCDEGNRLIAVVAGNAARFGVQSGCAIDEKQVAMMSVIQFETCHPTAVSGTLHGDRFGIPLIEIPHQANMAGLWRRAEEAHVVKGPSGVAAPRIGGRRSVEGTIHDLGLPGEPARTPCSLVRIASLLAVPMTLAARLPLTKNSNVGID